MLHYHFYTFDTLKVNFWRRLIAHFIDFALLAFIVVIGSVLFGLDNNYNYWILMFVFLVYSSWMDTYFAGTLGKLIMKLRVVGDNGEKINFLTAFYRNLTKILFTITGFEILLLPITKGYSGIHNRVAKTLIINAHN